MKISVMRRLGCLLIAMLTALALCGCTASQAFPDAAAADAGAALSVYFFSAGKADAILLTTENATVSTP